MRLFQNFSFGTASLDLREKPGPLTGFSKSLFQNRARERTVN
jgi:hypothetical protein